MASPLQFVVFAPGRSGTTAFALAFNAHPNVFCAVEFFPLKSDHTAFRMPGDMLALHHHESPSRAESIQILNEKLSKGEVAFYGNKMPNYYFKLEDLHRQLPHLKFFYIYRSPEEFVHSWDRRAKKENDKWPEGRLGIFGTIEQIFCLKRLAELPFDITMVSYRSLFFENPQLMAQVVGQLGVRPDAFDQHEFESNLFLQYKTKPTEHEDFYNGFFREYRFDLIDAFFAKNPLASSRNREFAEAVNQQFSALPESRRLIEFLEFIDPAAAEFAQTWRRQLWNLIDNRDSAASQWLVNYVGAGPRVPGSPRRGQREPAPSQGLSDPG
jgi:hypothetical protein